MPNVELGPWPLGENAYHSATPEHSVYQGSESAAPQLLYARNVQLDTFGWPARRNGLVERLSASAGLNSYHAFGSLLVQDGGSIKRLNPSGWGEATLVSGLTEDARVDFHLHAGAIWWTNGEVCGTISSAFVASHWGLTQPPVATLGGADGSLPAGDYLVACTVGDGTMESGAPDSATITLAEPGGISVDLSSVDDNATHVHIYAGSTNQDGLFWQRTVTVASLPATLSSLTTDARASERPLRTQFLRGPIPGDGVFSYLGQLCLYRGIDTFRSEGLSKHLFDPTHGDMLPDIILGAAGLETGFWRVTPTGAWWTTGTIGEEWRTLKKDDIPYAMGQAVVPGEIFPSLQTQALVALFVSEHGLMIGLPTGQMIRFTPDRLPLDVAGKRATFAIDDSNGVRSLLFSLI